MNEGRKADKAALIGLEKSIKELKKDVIENTNSNKNLDDKITIIDNTTNKNLERVTRLEEEIKLIKERERRRETGGKPKLIVMNADKDNDADKVASKHDKSKDGESNSDNNNGRDFFNRMMTGAEKTLDNWCNKESFAKIITGAATRDNSTFNTPMTNTDDKMEKQNNDILSKIKNFSTSKIDYFSHARKVIGL